MRASWRPYVLALMSVQQSVNVLGYYQFSFVAALVHRLETAKPGGRQPGKSISHDGPRTLFRVTITPAESNSFPVFVTYCTSNQLISVPMTRAGLNTLNAI